MSEMFNVLLGRSHYTLFTNNKKKLSFFFEDISICNEEGVILLSWKSTQCTLDNITVSTNANGGAQIQGK